MSDAGRINPRGLKPSTTNGDVLTTTGGVTVWAPPATPTIRPVPLTTVLGSTPDLVWDANDELVITEVTL